QLKEYAFGRAVGVLLERHWTNAQVELHRPHGLLGLRIDHGHNLPDDGAGYHVFAVRRDIRVVHTAFCRDGLDSLLRRRINDIHSARRLDDRHVDSPPVATDRDIVGRPLRAIRLVTCNVLASTMSKVSSASSLKYIRLPSGAAAAP